MLLARLNDPAFSATRSLPRHLQQVPEMHDQDPPRLVCR